MCWDNIQERINKLIDQNEPKNIINDCIYALQSLSTEDRVDKEALVMVHVNKVYAKTELQEIIQLMMWMINIDPKPHIDQLIYQQVNFSSYELSLKDSMLLRGFPKELYNEFLTSFCKEKQSNCKHILDEIMVIDQKMKELSEKEEMVYKYVNESMNLLNLILMAKRFQFLLTSRVENSIH